MTTPSPFDPQPCCGDAANASCMTPMQFCFTSTALVDEPGRQYDLSFTLGIGFDVEGIVKDLVETPVAIEWDIADVDATQFMADLTQALQTQFDDATITVTSGAQVDQCDGVGQFNVHIECLRLDEDPPTLLQLKYNAGRDLVLNPSFLSSNPINDIHDTYREDDALPPTGGVLPNAGFLDCTNVANRGWTTNDRARKFEGWGFTTGSSTGVSPWNAQRQTTPTPRGTPVFEINAYGSGPVANNGEPFGSQPDTIWQTFAVPADGDFNIRVVVGARTNVPGESIVIKLSTGDVNDTGAGNIINTTVSPGQVTNEDGDGNASNSIPGPWTTFAQTVPLTAGTYTLAFTGPDIDGSGNARNFGGLFTDMRVFQDIPNTLGNFANDDEACTVPTNVATTRCEFWQPRCAAGEITEWTNVALGVTLDNAAFWSQVPAPSCCDGATSDGNGTGNGGGTPSNQVYSYLVCATTETGNRTLSRVVVSDANGTTISAQFVDTSGNLINPSAWQPGQCPDTDILSDIEIEILCDVSPDGTVTEFLRRYRYDAQGNVVSLLTSTLDGVTPYVITGVVGDCARISNTFTTTGLCLGDNTPIGVINRRTGTGTIVQDGWVNLLTGGFSAGAPPIGTSACGSTVNVQTSDVLCDITTATGDVNGLVLIQYNYNPDGSIASTEILNATTGAPYVPVGAITVCPTDQGQPDHDMWLLCDVQSNGSVVTIIRDYNRDVNGLINGFSDYNASTGTPYTPTGTVSSCVGRDAENQILCDSAGTRFLRTYAYGTSGNILTVTDTTLAGAAFTPVGAVGVCTISVTADTDFVEETMSDSNGTCFLRLFRFNSLTGALVSTTNTTLAGAAFTPVGAVTAGCGGCCPNVIGEGCTNTGSGHYTAIRAANGTISLIDSVSGTAVTQAQIITCPGDDAVRTLTAQARQLTNATPWTPGGDVSGTLTSVTVTGLSGLWDLVDANGTTLTGLPAGLSLTWEAEDDNHLTGPQSVTPQVGASVVANWTQV